MKKIVFFLLIMLFNCQISYSREIPEINILYDVMQSIHELKSQQTTTQEEIAVNTEKYNIDIWQNISDCRNLYYYSYTDEGLQNLKRTKYSIEAENFINIRLPIGKVTAKSGIKIRSLPNTNSDVVGKLYNNEHVIIIFNNGPFSQIDDIYNN